MPKKERPLVDRHPQKNGEGWLLNQQDQLIDYFRNALPSARTKWIELKGSPMRGSGQQIVRRMLSHNAIEAWNNNEHACLECLDRRENY